MLPATTRHPMLRAGMPLWERSLLHAAFFAIMVVIFLWTLAVVLVYHLGFAAVAISRRARGGRRLAVIERTEATEERAS